MVQGPILVLPRELLGSILKQAGIPRLDQVPRKLAMYLGAENLSPEVKLMANALADPDATIECAISVGGVTIHVVVK